MIKTQVISTVELNTVSLCVIFKIWQSISLEYTGFLFLNPLGSKVFVSSKVPSGEIVIITFLVRCLGGIKIRLVDNFILPFAP